MTKYGKTRRLLVALFVSMTAAAVIAASPHYKKDGQPVCTINTVNGTATCTSGTVSGLGNADVQVSVSLDASAGTFCHNKGNPDNIVPGQNPAIAVGTSTLNFSADQIKNGTLVIPPINVTVTVATPSAATAGCPNDNWTVTLGTITYGPGFYAFYQPPGTLIQQLSFQF
jgi:hypothetical protein